MGRVYFYVVARDFGFAPNPFHGVCTLATCKPAIRRTAEIGDWIVGMGGSRLQSTGRCIFAMRVTGTLTFDEYWSDRRYYDKRPVRNGSRRMMVGDNIYHHDPETGVWVQADSHHSQADGTVNTHNLERDTKTDRVLLSSQFFYFGSAAVSVPESILAKIGFTNRQGHRVYTDQVCEDFIKWLHDKFRRVLSQVLRDPFDFERSDARYSVKTNRIS